MISIAIYILVAHFIGAIIFYAVDNMNGKFDNVNPEGFYSRRRIFLMYLCSWEYQLWIEITNRWRK